MYRLAYEALPATDRAGDFGEDIVNRVTALTRQDEFLESAGTAGLEEASALIERYLDDVERFEFERKVSQHQKNLAKLALLVARVKKQEQAKEAEEQLQQQDDETRPLPATPSPFVEPAELGTPAVGSRDSSPPRDTVTRRPLVIGLSVGGAALAIGSLGFFLNAARISGYVDQVESDLDDPSLSEEDRRVGQDYIEENNPRAAASSAGGVIMLLAGLGLIGGAIAVDVIDRKRARASASLFPSISRSGAGLSLSGRF